MRRWMAIALFAALPASAQVYPQAGTGDPRIQTVQYDADKVIHLGVAPGLQMLVELAPGDTIQTIGVGDSLAWQVSAGKRGDFFFVKNMNANAVTNMTVVTGSRVYNFELAPANGYGQLSPYHVRLVYPPRSQGRAIIDTGPRFEYRLSGNKAIRPSAVYQEGTQTILEWPESAPLPGIFMLDNGTEALVNGEMQDGRFVIAGTPAKLIFRLDRKTAYASRRQVEDVSDE